MRHSFTTIFLLTGVLLLGGCGQTGPLYLPKAEPAAKAKPEPAEQTSTGAEQAQSS